MGQIAWQANQVGSISASKKPPTISKDKYILVSRLHACRQSTAMGVVYLHA